MKMGNEVLWLFGRGLSIGCGLLWDDLSNCQQSSRDGKIGCIKRQLRQAMDAPGVSPDPIRDFLRFLSRRTEKGTRHRFLTTNWDYLLQREVSAFAETIGGGPHLAIR